jgi:hypothetical protein
MSAPVHVVAEHAVALPSRSNSETFSVMDVWPMPNQILFISADPGKTPGKPAARTTVRGRLCALD